MSLPPRWTLTWIAAGLGIVAVGALLIVLNDRVTSWIASDKFRDLLDQETSKGMKFEGHYRPFERVGLLGMHTEDFHGNKGVKTIVSIDAHEISGWFNPLGVGLRQWEIHALHMQSGTVWIQKTEAKPGEPKGVPPIPWWAIFWPYHVELEDVKCDDADVLFKLQEKESGIYHTFLEITPNGRDFEYDGKGGTFKTPMTPELNLEHVHLLIRKPRLYCPVFVLGDDPTHPEERMEVTGDAGLQDDRSMHVQVAIKSLRVAPWLPEKLRANVLGHVNGQLDYHSTGTGLESGEAQGTINVADAILHDLPAMQQYVKLTGSPDPGDLHLQVCQTNVHYDKGAVTAENLKIECPGVFKLEGTVSMSKDKALSGQLQLGVTHPYLKWLPTAETAIFTRTDGDYHTTTVQVSGTSAKPSQDLSARVMKELSKSPLVAVKLFFNEL